MVYNKMVVRMKLPQSTNNVLCVAYEFLGNTLSLHCQILQQIDQSHSLLIDSFFEIPTKVILLFPSVVLMVEIIG
jgi:hypothetical protein